MIRMRVVQFLPVFFIFIHSKALNFERYISSSHVFSQVKVHVIQVIMALMLVYRTLFAEIFIKFC